MSKPDGRKTKALRIGERVRPLRKAINRGINTKQHKLDVMPQGMVALFGKALTVR